VGDDPGVGRFAIDDNRDVLRRARTHHRFLVASMLVISAYGVAGIVGTIWTGHLGLLVVVAIAVYGGVLQWERHTLNWKPPWPVTRAAVADRLGDQGVIVVDEPGLVICHPVLAEALRLDWNGLRAFAVEAPVPPGAFGQRRSFPIRRSPGTLRVIGSEPSHFLTSNHAGGALGSIPLAGIDLGSLRPNVAVLFTDPQDITIAAPAFSDDHGWTPPERSIPAVRAWRTMRVFGAYLRVLDWERLSTELDAHGARNGFTTEDWRHATRTPKIERTSHPPAR
jgi:hypothetical protein